MRKLKYFSLLLQAFLEREDLKTNKNVLFTIEEVIAKALTLIVECNQKLSGESFKKFYMEQITVTLLKTLNLLYKGHFGDKQIRGEIIPFLSSFMEISNEEAINCVCGLMRAFLLKKIEAMAGCPAL